MAWTTPKTWSNIVLPASDLNTYVRDNLNFLYGRDSASLTSSGTQTIAAATTWTQVTILSTTEWQRGAAVVGTNQLTVKTAGLYTVTMGAQGGASDWQVGVFVNAAGPVVVAHGAANDQSSGGRLRPLNVNDVLTLYAYVAAGGTVMQSLSLGMCWQGN